MIKVIDDTILIDDVNKIESTIKNSKFPLYMQYQGTVVDGYDIGLDSSALDNVIEPPQLTHVFFVDGKILSEIGFEVIGPIKRALEEDLGFEIDILKAKANINFPSSKLTTNDNHYYPHIDINPPDEIITAIYYVSDSDGDTFFFEEGTGFDSKLKIMSRLSPKKGRIVYFNAGMLHAGQPPIMYDTRTVININFVKAGSAFKADLDSGANS